MTLSLRVAHLIPDTEAEGPGRRFAIWVQGCPLRCPGCCNPEYLAFAGGVDRPTGALADEILATPHIEGVSLLGGEPMSQPEAVLDLCRRVRRAGLTVMLYTGFTLAELRARARPAVRALLAELDLLVDGRYERDRPDTERRWIGSTNQALHFLSDRYAPSDPRFAAPNTIELRLGPGGLTVNGWPAHADAVLAHLGARPPRA